MFPTKNKSINKGAAFMAIAFMLLFLIIFFRFIYIEKGKTVSHQDLSKLGQSEWITKKIIDSHRGTIFDSQNKALAYDIPAYSIYAVIKPSVKDHVKNPEMTASKLSPILGIPKSTILNQLNKKGLYQVEFGTKGRMLSQDVKNKIDALHLSGIHFTQETNRYYPNQAFASYVLGFTTFDQKADKQKGVMGIEGELNKYLTEQDGKISFYSDKSGIKLPNTQQNMKAPHNGDNVYLTLDSRIQSVLDDAMSQVNAKYKPKKMIGIVADPKTGKILAMSNYPTFNPNKRNLTNYANYAISSPFEPGSVMKIFTLSAAVNQGVWPGNQTYQSGSYNVGGITIHDWNTSWGKITFNEGLMRSSNVGFSIIGNKYLGTDELFKYLDAFGFNKKTGIDLPGESTSLLATKYKASEVSTAFGQGSAVTAIQLVQAATAVANNGKMMKPFVVDKVVDPNTGKTVIQHKPQVVGHPITKASAIKVRDLLRTVVSPPKGEYATGTLYNLPGYDVIGKTGTAQIPNPKDPSKGYLANQYVHSFLGMAPKNNPKLIVYVAVDRPHLKAGQSGDDPVSQIFKPVMLDGLQYLSISPNKTTSKVNNTAKLEDVTNQSVDQAKNHIEQQGFSVTVLGHGNVQEELPMANTSLIKGSRIILKGQGPYQMPDVTGWSLSDALKLSEALNIKPNTLGSGFVIKQKPQAGTAIKSGDYLYFQFQDPTKPLPKNPSATNKSGN